MHLLSCSIHFRLVQTVYTQFILETETFRYTLGTVLMQKFEDELHPVTFYSCSLLPAEKNYNAHNKEFTGVIFGFKCSQPFLLGAKHVVKVHTDHKNLQYFCKPPKITGRQARWIEFLQDFNYQLEHIPGSSNTIADLLSCHKDLNKGVDSDKPRVLLPDTLFAQKIFLKDNTEE